MNDEYDPLTERLRRGLAHTTPPELGADVVAGAATRTPPRLADPRRRLQAAGGATLAIAAVTVGALVLTSPAQQAPLFAASGAAPATAMGADSAATDLRIANWVDYRYEAGPGLGTDGGTGTVYELRRTGTAEQVLAAAADALGLEGDPAKSGYFDEAFPTYVIGPEDGSGPSLSITWVGTGGWWYSDPGAYPQFECADTPVSDDALPEERVCAAPETPAENLAPAEAEARSIARDLFAATGLDVAEGDIRVTADEWQTVATAGLVVDGVATAIEWSVAWSPSGAIAWASGHAIEAVDRGVYDTVSPAEAVTRLADGRWFGAPGPDYQGGMTIFAADAMRVDDLAIDPVAPEPDASGEPEPAPSVDPSTDPGTPTEEPAPEPDVTILPEPLPELPEPEIVTVSVDEAESTLLLVWDVDGNAWLVPGYAMPHPDGWWNVVISLVEGVIELPAPMEIEPLILDDEAIDG